MASKRNSDSSMATSRSGVDSELDSIPSIQPTIQPTAHTRDRGGANFKMDGKKHTAKWNGVVIAETDKSVLVENNHYFPPDSIKMDFFKPSPKTSVCPWKGDCKYYDVAVNGKVNKAAAWYYPNPKDAAQNIKGYVAFWAGVEVD